MDQPDRDPGRRSLPHYPPHDVVNQSIITYVTVTVEKRRPILHRADAVEVILNAWKAADRWLVGRYVIMPDHIHFFCAPAMMPGAPLKPWMQFWRSTATRHWPFSAGSARAPRRNHS